MGQCGGGIVQELGLPKEKAHLHRDAAWTARRADCTLHQPRPCLTEHWCTLGGQDSSSPAAVMVLRKRFNNLISL